MGGLFLWLGFMGNSVNCWVYRRHKSQAASINKLKYIPDVDHCATLSNTYVLDLCHSFLSSLCRPVDALYISHNETVL